MTDKQRLALQNAQPEKHLCVHCNKVLELCEQYPWDESPWDGTHGDTNNCEYFYNSCYYQDDVTCECPDDSGNTRYYSHGMKTVDNGSGYDIIACPYYKELSYEILYNIEYSAYMNSPEWKKNRYPALVRDGFKCAMCGTAKNLIVHHITYERLGHENMDALITLCKGCHAKVHENDLSKKGANHAE